MGDLGGLDKYLRHCCDSISLVGKHAVDAAKQRILEDRLKKQLLQISFEKGFKAPHKRYKIKKKSLQVIKQSWV